MKKILLLIMTSMLLIGCRPTQSLSTEMPENETEILEQTIPPTENIEEPSIPLADVPETYEQEKDKMEETLEMETENETIQETEEETIVESTEELIQETQIQTEPEPETLPEFSVEPLSHVMWAKSSVNVRDYPGTEGTKIGGLSFAQPVNVTGKASTGWWQVEYNGNVGYISGNYLLDYEPQPETQAPAPTVNIPSNIWFEDGVPQDAINAVLKYWYMMPEQTRNLITNHGWKIACYNQRWVGEYVYNYEYEYPYALGVTRPIDKTVVLGNTVKGIRRSLTHELGHVVDFIHGGIYKSSEWKEIWEAEHGNMQIQEKYDDHPTHSPQEFFGECVLQYIQYNDLLYRTCPRAYEFVSRYIY